MSFTVTSSLTRTRTQLSADFLDLDQLYSELYCRCSRDQLLWRPSNGGWSIAECIEHVARANSQYLPPIKTAIAKGEPTVSARDYLLAPGGWFSAAFLKRIGPQITVKFKAPGKIRPVSVEPEQAFQELRRGHIEIQELLSPMAQRDLNRIRFKNPFIPVLHFTVATGLLIMAAHGRRHLEQAQRLKTMDGFRSTKADRSA
jgi:DinB family protein